MPRRNRNASHRAKPRWLSPVEEAEPRTQTPDQLANALVRNGLASPRILGYRGTRPPPYRKTNPTPTPYEGEQR